MVISVTGDIFPWMFWLAIIPFILFCCAMNAASEETQEWYDKHPDHEKKDESPPFTSTDKWAMALLAVWVLFWLPQVLHWTIPFFMHLRLVW